MPSPRRPARRRRRRQRALPLWAVAAAAAVVAFGAGYYLGSRPSAGDGPGEAARVEPAAPQPRAMEAAPSLPEREPALPPAVEMPAEIPEGRGARIALVIDDLGRRPEDVDDFEALGVPISYGVLPFESRTAQVVGELRARGAEILCHLPMEPSNGADPGPGALTRAMTRRELERATRWALDAIDGAVGVNNHMGSGMTSDPEIMRTILEVLRDRRLFFLDSRTSAETVAYTTARAMDLPAAERQVFLDPEAGASTVREQFRRLLAIAHERGAAIAIGHPHPSTLSVLREEVPRALAAGYQFVPVSYLLDRTAAAS